MSKRTAWASSLIAALGLYASTSLFAHADTLPGTLAHLINRALPHVLVHPREDARTRLTPADAAAPLSFHERVENDRDLLSAAYHSAASRGAALFAQNANIPAAAQILNGERNANPRLRIQRAVVLARGGAKSAALIDLANAMTEDSAEGQAFYPTALRMLEQLREEPSAGPHNLRGLAYAKMRRHLGAEDFLRLARIAHAQKDPLLAALFMEDGIAATKASKRASDHVQLVAILDDGGAQHSAAAWIEDLAQNDDIPNDMRAHAWRHIADYAGGRDEHMRQHNALQMAYKFSEDPRDLEAAMEVQAKLEPQDELPHSDTPEDTEAQGPTVVAESDAAPANDESTDDTSSDTPTETAEVVIPDGFGEDEIERDEEEDTEEASPYEPRRTAHAEESEEDTSEDESTDETSEEEDPAEDDSEPVTVAEVEDEDESAPEEEETEPEDSASAPETVADADTAPETAPLPARRPAHASLSRPDRLEPSAQTITTRYPGRRERHAVVDQGPRPARMTATEEAGQRPTPGPKPARRVERRPQSQTVPLPRNYAGRVVQDVSPNTRQTRYRKDRDLNRPPVSDAKPARKARRKEVHQEVSPETRNTRYPGRLARQAQTDKPAPAERPMRELPKPIKVDPVRQAPPTVSDAVPPAAPALAPVQDPIAAPVGTVEITPIEPVAGPGPIAQPETATVPVPVAKRRPLTEVVKIPALVSGKCTKGLEGYRNLHKDDEVSPLTHFAAAECYRARGDNTDALIALNLALQAADETDKETRRYIWQSIGELQEYVGNYHAAARAWQQAHKVSKAPADRIGWARAERLGGNVHKAQGLLEKIEVTRLRADVKPLYYDEVAASWVEDDAEKSLAAVDTALALQNTPERHVMMADIHRKLGNRKARTGALEMAAALEPDNAGTRHALAYAYAEEGNHRMAVESFGELVALEPDDPKLMIDYGHALKADGQYSRAAQTFRLAVDRMQAQEKETRTAAAAAKAEERLYEARREVGEIEQDAYALATFIMQTGDRDQTFTTFDALPDQPQISLEIGWHPAFFEEWTGTRLTAMARIMGAFHPESIRYLDSTTQVRAGLRWHPLPDFVDWSVAGEYQTGFGNQVKDNWLASTRLRVADGDGFKPHKKMWNVTSLTGEATYGFAPEFLALYAEVMQGRAIRVAQDLAIIPQVGVTARYYEDNTDSQTLIDAGAGASVRFWFRDNEYFTHQSFLDLSVQYRQYLANDTGEEDGRFWMKILMGY